MTYNAIVKQNRKAKILATEVTCLNKTPAKNCYFFRHIGECIMHRFDQGIHISQFAISFREFCTTFHMPLTKVQWGSITPKATSLWETLTFFHLYDLPVWHKCKANTYWKAILNLPALLTYQVLLFSSRSIKWGLENSAI